MRSRLQATLIFLELSLAAMSTSAMAHYSFSAEFDSAYIITLKGDDEGRLDQSAKPGDDVTVDAFMAKDGSKHLAHIKAIRFADGPVMTM